MEPLPRRLAWPKVKGVGRKRHRLLISVAGEVGGAKKHAGVGEEVTLGVSSKQCRLRRILNP